MPKNSTEVAGHLWSTKGGLYNILGDLHCKTTTVFVGSQDSYITYCTFCYSLPTCMKSNFSCFVYDSGRLGKMDSSQLSTMIN